MRCNSRLRNGQQLLLPRIRKPAHLRHINILSRDARRKRPRESMEQTRQREQHQGLPQIVARTRAPPGAENVEPIIGKPRHIARVSPSLRVELHRLHPHSAVAARGEQVEENEASSGDVVACELGRRHGLAGEGEAVRGAETEGLLDYAHEVVQLR